MFWEIDKIAMDLSENEPTKVTKIAPSSATDETGKEVVKQLHRSDQLYFTQEQGGRLNVQFPAPPGNLEMDRTVYIKNRGYYNYVRDYKGFPDIDYLETFKEEGAFTQFAYDRYVELIESEKELLASKIN